MSTVDRKEHVQIDHLRGKGTLRRESVEDVGRERQVLVARLVNILWLAVTALEILLGARLVLKLIAANPGVPFARFIYQTSAWFLGPFRGLTITPSANGIVFEVSTIIAMAAYVLAGWLAVKLIWLVMRPAAQRSVKTYEEFR